MQIRVIEIKSQKSNIFIKNRVGNLMIPDPNCGKISLIWHYFASVIMVLPALWAVNCGAYWHWMVAMPEVNSPGLVTHTS